MLTTEIFDLLKAKFPRIAKEEGTSAVIIPKELLLEFGRFIKDAPLIFDDLHCVTAIDKKEKIDLVYIFYSNPLQHSLTLKIYLGPEDPKVESLAAIWKSANWLERETYDLFGVTFLNHPDPRRILNPYDWKGYPLRKDYEHIPDKFD